MSAGRRAVPAVHALLERDQLRDLARSAGRDVVTQAARQALAEARDRAARGEQVASMEELVRSVERTVGGWLAPRPRPVLNATGVVLHTNLGRAPVSRAAGRAMQAAATAYCDLEYDLAEGERGSRQDLVAPLLCRLTGAEAALVVNNNAGATLLALSALAAGREVLVSRGQLVEIGGGYRIPSIMAASGARLVEVGTTNRTHARDYRSAIGPDTAMVLRVHASNFRIVGFAAEVSLSELASIAREHDLHLLDDLGSGCLLDTAAFGLAHEPAVGESLAAGADLACFSGDKLLGGPQAGLIVGRRKLVERLRESPLARALRPGKSTLAGLHATLLHYARGEAERQVPVWRMIAAGAHDLAARAEAWQAELAKAGRAAATAEALSTVGGGSLPGQTLPTTVLAVTVSRPHELAAALRTGQPPVVARIAGQAVLLDPRTVLPEDDEVVLDALGRALDSVSHP